MIDVFKIEASVFGRKNSVVLDNKLALELDYADYEADENILKDVEKTFRTYLKTLHDLHDNPMWKEFTVTLYTDNTDDTMIDFVFNKDEYLLKQSPVDNRYTHIQEVKWSGDTLIKRRNEVVNTIMNRMKKLIDCNVQEAL